MQTLFPWKKTWCALSECQNVMPTIASALTFLSLMHKRTAWLLHRVCQGGERLAKVDCQRTVFLYSRQRLRLSVLCIECHHSRGRLHDTCRRRAGSGPADYGKGRRVLYFPVGKCVQDSAHQCHLLCRPGELISSEVQGQHHLSQNGWCCYQKYRSIEEAVKELAQK